MWFSDQNTVKLAKSVVQTKTSYMKYFSRSILQIFILKINIYLKIKHYKSETILKYVFYHQKPSKIMKNHEKSSKLMNSWKTINSYSHKTYNNFQFYMKNYEKSCKITKKYDMCFIV